MSTIHERFSGLFIPHVTPFDQSGAVDLQSLKRLTIHFASLPGVAGLVSCAHMVERAAKAAAITPSAMSAEITKPTMVFIA